MVERLKFKRLADEDAQEERAKSEFRRKVMAARVYREDHAS